MLKSLAALIVALALAFVFNPSPERHRKTLEATLSERSPLSKALNLGALAAFVSDYHSWGVVSYTVVNGKVLTVGAYGMVFVRD